MGSALVPFSRAPSVAYVTETFEGWSGKGWTLDQSVTVGSVWDPDGSFAASDFAGAYDPVHSKLTRSFGSGDGLPVNSLVRVEIDMSWILAEGAEGGTGITVTGLVVGAWVGDQFQQPTAFGFSAPANRLAALARTDASGNLFVAVGIAGMHGSFDLSGSFNAITISSVVGDFADLIIDSAVLIVDGMQLTISRGSWSFDPGEEWEDFTFPGRTMNVKGARELVRLKPVIKGNAMMAGEVQISAYRPDGLWADHATIAGARTFTPNALRAYLTATDYLKYVFLVWKRQRGDYIAVEFPSAICGSYSLGSQDNDEGLFPLVIEAVQDLSLGGTTRTTVPYKIHTLPGDTETTDLPAGSDS